MPESDQLWTIEEFVEKTEEVCRLAAVDLYRKSMMVEEAVEEVLDLVKNAAENFKGAANSNQFEFFNTEGDARHYLTKSSLIKFYTFLFHFFKN